MIAALSGLSVLVWKSIPVAGGALLLSATLRGKSASVRHGVLATGFGLLLVLSISQLVLPALPVAVLPAETGRMTGPLPVVRSPAVAPALPAADAIAPAAGSAAVDRGDGLLASSPARAGAVAPEKGFAWPSVLVAIWLIGSIALVSRLAIDLARLARIARRGARPPESWDAAIQRSVRALGRSRAPARVRVSDEVVIAAVWGAARPVVVLPAAARAWSGRRLEVVLTHEFAHVLRRDPLTTVAAELAAALFWANPLVWVSLRRLRFEREAACDERVLRAGTARSLYADELLAAARDLRGQLRPRIAMATRSGLHRRIETILGYSGQPAGSLRYGRSIVVVALLLVGPALGACSLTPRDSNAASLDDRVRATWVLGDLEDPAAVPELIELLDDPSPQIRGMAAWSLGEIKDRSAAPALMARLNDPDPVAREMFVRTLGELRDPAAVGALEALLEDPSPPVRAAAVWALGEFGGPFVWEAIARATGDRSVDVRKTAIQVLAESGNRVGDAALRAGLADDAPAIRAFSARSFAGSSFEAIDALIQALDDPAPEVRREVARTLGMIGHPDALDALIAHLRDPDLEVRSWAVWALDEIDPEVDAAHPKAGFDRERLVAVTN